MYTVTAAAAGARRAPATRDGARKRRTGPGLGALGALVPGQFTALRPRPRAGAGLFAALAQAGCPPQGGSSPTKRSFPLSLQLTSCSARQRQSPCCPPCQAPCPGCGSRSPGAGGTRSRRGAVLARGSAGLRRRRRREGAHSWR